MKGTLTLIPTPIDEEHPLEGVAHSTLMQAATEHVANSIFVIEDLKPGRRRWLKWKLPREIVDDFVLYNEHTAKEVCHDLLAKLKKGVNVFIMSDGGLPAFCDPGIELVSMCHDHGIRVTSTPFYNSISLALALSGFNHNRFQFEGFLPVKDPERGKQLERVLTDNQTLILMDTPYRMKKLLAELDEMLTGSKISRRVFVGMDLNSENELLVRGTISQVMKRIDDFKREFILILEARERSQKRSH